MAAKAGGEAGQDGGARAPARLLEVPPNREGQRLDNFLFASLKGLPRSLVYRLLRTGQVRVNGKRARPELKLGAGDAVRVPPLRLEPAGTPPKAPAGRLAGFERAVLAEDRALLVIDKPHGVAAHGGSGVSHGAIELLRQARPAETLELVHRLDRDTSGVLLLARRRSALLAAQAEMREERVRKRYLALLVGRLARDRVRVDQPLRKSVLQGGERMVRVDAAGKPSLSTFSVLERFRDATLVEVVIATGRTHQIRVHAAHLGHPVAGDPKYGDAEANRALRAFGLGRLFLHAAELAIDLGDGQGERLYSAPLPAELAGVLERLPRR